MNQRTCTHRRIVWFRRGLLRRLCFASRTVRVCDAFLLRVCVAFLLELTELAKPVEMPCLGDTVSVVKRTGECKLVRGVQEASSASSGSSSCGPGTAQMILGDIGGTNARFELVCVDLESGARNGDSIVEVLLLPTPSARSSAPSSARSSAHPSARQKRESAHGLTAGASPSVVATSTAGLAGKSKQQSRADTNRGAPACR